MALDLAFAESFINERHWIAGRRVRPFSAWHIALLQTLKSPYLIAEAAIEPHDALTLIAVCSLPYGRSRTRRPRNPLSWLSTRNKKGFERLNQRILNYIGDFLQKPEFAIHVTEQGNSPRRGQPPEILQAVWDVIFATKWPEHIAWELPIGVLYWYQVMALKEKYDVDIIDDEERALQEKLAAHIAKKKAEKEAKSGA